MWRADSLEKTLRLGKIESQKEKKAAEDEMLGWLDGITILWTWTWANSGRWWETERPGMFHDGEELDMTEWLRNNW